MGKLAKAAVAGISAIGLAAGGAYYFERENTIPLLEAADPEDMPPIIEPSLMCPGDIPQCDANTALYVFSDGVPNVPVAFDQISDTIKQAVVVKEDEHFYQHNGISVRGIYRSIYVNVKARDVRQGASTLTMQALVAERGLKISPSTSGKLKEMEYALRFEMDAPGATKIDKKNYILGVFFNNATFAGGKGVEAATLRMFGHSANSLNYPEAAALAGSLESPASMDEPSTKPNELANLKDAQQRVLKKLLDKHLITDIQYEEFIKTPLVFNSVPVPAKGGNTPLTDTLDAEYFVDVVRAELKGIKISEHDLATKGLRIVTTLDTHAQEVANAAVKWLEPPEGPEAGMVVMTPTGAIVAMIGGRSYHIDQGNITLLEGETGSALKQAILAAIFENNPDLTPDTLVEIPYEAVWPKGNNGQDWVISNHRGCDADACTLSQALANSSNPFFVNAASKLGDRPIEILRGGGLDMKDPMPAYVLGSVSESLVDLNAYQAMFVNGGVAVSPGFITSVVGRGNTVVWTNKGMGLGDRVIDREVAEKVIAASRMVVRNGTASEGFAGFPEDIDVECKTGTQDDNVVAMIMCGTTRYIVSVRMQYRSVREPMPFIYGGNTPAQMVRNYLIGIGLPEVARGELLPVG